MRKQFETIRYCQSSIEAEMLKLKLENAGVESHVLDDAMAFGGLSPKTDGVRLQVNADDLERAKEILSEQE